MMQSAGSFLRARMVRLSMWGMLAAGILLGLSAGLLLLSVERWIGLLWVVVAYAAIAAAVFLAWRILDSGRWDLDRLKKGMDAEERVGQLIEYGITARDCAVAHSVTKIAKVGDIDHIVATPAGIWVIETKYRKVPRHVFPEVLGRIAANADAVRKWAPAGTHVRGCLVLAYERGTGKKTYTRGNEKIAVYTEKTLGDLRRELRKEARGGKQPDGQIAGDIWNLGRVAG